MLGRIRYIQQDAGGDDKNVVLKHFSKDLGRRQS